MIVRISDDILSVVKRIQGKDGVTRPDAIRTLVELGISGVVEDDFQNIEPGHHPTQLWLDQGHINQVNDLMAQFGRPKSTIVRAALTKGARDAA